ncbi:MAG: threonine dehydratase [Rhodospirillales bacterium]|nr:threonine dehydratase [Rhodospirillales bacterium]
MIDRITLTHLEDAARRIHAVLPPTAQYCWPLLSTRGGAEIWVKHENHTPVGAFKVRGGVLYMSELKSARPGLTGVIAATRGNHGQSVAFAAGRVSMTATVVVPHGNSAEKNAAMRVLGAVLIEHGSDFQEAYEYARRLAAEKNLHFVDSFHADLVRGVGTYALELFRAGPNFDRVYVPIGMGSGICGAMAARDALGLRTEIVGVVAEGAPCYALSFAAGKPVSTNAADTFADGLACRVPNSAALDAMLKGVARVVTVSDAEIGAAMRAYFADTHNVVEGAGAAPLAAALQERRINAGRRIGVIASGGNIDRDLFVSILRQDQPEAAK